MNKTHGISLIAGALALAATAVATSCGNEAKDTSTWDSTEQGEEETAREEGAGTPYSDLKMFELHGSVKSCVKQTYYDIAMDDNKVRVDSGIEPRVTKHAFDRNGQYVTSESELLKRDDRGRITYWRDKRPNAKGTAPGLLRDTLAYKHINDNLMQSSGMGEFAITVYDNNGNIAGQYSKPDIDGTEMSAFNVYRKFDDEGNWTERLTIWTSSSKGGKPHISYSLDRREIEYY